MDDLYKNCRACKTKRISKMDKTGNVVPQDLIQLAPGEVLNIDFFKQAEAEVVPSSSLVELEVEVWVEFEVWVWV